MSAKPKYRNIGWAFFGCGFFWQAALIVINGLLLRAGFIGKIPTDITVYKFTMFGAAFIIPEMAVPLLLVFFGTFGIYYEPLVDFSERMVRASRWGNKETKGGKK